MIGSCLTAHVLNQSPDIIRLRLWGKSTLVGLLIVSLGFTTLLAASPSLHQWFHRHAKHQANHQHQCAVTLIQKQQTLTSDSTTVMVAVDSGLSVEIDLFCHFAASSADCLLSDSRAPPAAISSQI